MFFCDSAQILSIQRGRAFDTQYLPATRAGVATRSTRSPIGVTAVTAFIRIMGIGVTFEAVAIIRMGSRTRIRCWRRRRCRSRIGSRCRGRIGSRCRTSVTDLLFVRATVVVLGTQIVTPTSVGRFFAAVVAAGRVLA